MSVLVTLDGEFRDPTAPLLFADDLAAVRGDGVFETLLVREGGPGLLEAHLQRLAQSADMMDLPEPDFDAWRRAAAAAASRWTSESALDGVMRL
ncbi:MAG: aminotransferase class IV, partial [Mycobacteriaceae bacterium]|nr:aminotransferase class IV [Mycobacteriaceae bacterium]